MEEVRLSELSKGQKDIAALLAFECLVKHNTPSRSFEGIQTAIHACNLLEVSQDAIQDIYSGKIKGLANLYKATLSPFESDYVLKLKMNLNDWFPCDQYPQGVKYVLMDLDGMADYTLAWRDRGSWKTQSGEQPGRHARWTYLHGVG